VYPYKYKGSTRKRGVKTGVGYKMYIQKHMSDGPLTEVEYRAFLNMWLCRFVFCGKANEPTLNHIVMAEDLAPGHPIPLGKYLQGSVYHMLHQTTHLMHTSQKISCVNGPWWFVQMWLQLYMHQIVGIDLNNRHFPSSNYKIREIDFEADLVILTSSGIDVILGMDWLSKHDGIILCAKKSVLLTTPQGDRIEFAATSPKKKEK
jgi:hypothetical protein